MPNPKEKIMSLTADTQIDETAVESPQIDADKLMGFVFRAVDEVGAALNAALVVMGDKLGYYRDLAENGPTTPSQLAERTQTAEPYAREWLNAQAAGEYLTYDPETKRYTLPIEHAIAMTDPDSPAFLPGFFQIALGTMHSTDHIIDAARSGAGFAWGDAESDVHAGCERFFRPNYHANLVESWIPALAGVEQKLIEGASVADVGCGHGASTILLAQAFPNSTFVGFDSHAASIATARERARDAGVDDRVRFEVATAQEFGGSGYDFVATFDSLHDMGDPVGAAQHVRDALSEDGTWMIVEPMAGDRVEDNLNPVGRVYYGFSTLLCTPSSLSQDVGLALGTQAGPARIHDVTSAGGFTQFRTAAETPFNRVIEVKR